MTEATSGLDIIADVHGMIATFHSMLKRLGYERHGDRWLHPAGRRLVQLGDLVDRGPDPLGCVELMQELVQSDIADFVLGNHEVNALGWFVGARAHTDANRRQFRVTLNQIERDAARWDRAARFLRTQPLSAERHGMRFVHAAWIPEALHGLPTTLASDDIVRATGRGGRYHESIETALKGPEEDAPQPFEDEHGITRRRRRVRWWDDYPAHAPTVCFGHYWFHGTPRLLGVSGNAICLDYSCGRGGPLVALRWPERHFVMVPNRDVDAPTPPDDA